MKGPVAIIGAGLAGLTAARTLTAAGVPVIVFEKSRGVGGRLATRRTRSGLDFDHGAPWVTPDAAAFADFLRAATAASDAAAFDGWIIGVPGMSALPRSLAAGLDIRFETSVEAVAPVPGGWRVNGETFPAVICTAPAPQTARLCGAIPAIARAAASARMIPCWTLMAAWNSDARRAESLTAPLAQAVRISGRPQRAPAPERWVAHAAPDWTLANLERAREDVAPVLLAALAASLDLDPGAAIRAEAHRWRYARVAQPVGPPCVAVGDIVAAGDWLLGPNASDAHASGLAAAAAILSRQGGAGTGVRDTATRTAAPPRRGGDAE